MSDALTQAPGGPTGQNPLTAGPQINGPAGAAPSHSAAAAQIAAMNLTPQEMSRSAEASTYAANQFGKLARNPDLKPKDVVKLAADLVAHDMAKPDVAIKLIASMPSDDRHLGAWVKSLYGASLSSAVHLKAALLAQGFPLPDAKKTKKPAAAVQMAAPTMAPGTAGMSTPIASAMPAPTGGEMPSSMPQAMP